VPAELAKTLLDDTGNNFDPARILGRSHAPNEKPGVVTAKRSVAVGVLDMAFLGIANSESWQGVRCSGFSATGIAVEITERQGFCLCAGGYLLSGKRFGNGLAMKMAVILIARLFRRWK